MPTDQPVSTLPEGADIHDNFSVYGQSLSTIVRDAYERKSWRKEIAGESDGIAYSEIPTDRKGKQQPVLGMELTFPDGSQRRVVCKRDDQRGTPGMYQRHPAMRAYLPALLLVVDDILVLDWVDGAELEPYAEALEVDPALRIQCAQAMAALIDAFARDGLRINDVNFATGHNVKYVPESGEFRLFDVHACSETDTSYDETVLQFLQNAAIRYVTGEKPRVLELAYFCDLVHALRSHAPLELLSYEGELTVTVRPGDDAYAALWAKDAEELRQNGFLVALSKDVTLVQRLDGRICLQADSLAACSSGPEALWDALQRSNAGILQMRGNA